MNTATLFTPGEFAEAQAATAAAEAARQARVANLRLLLQRNRLTPAQARAVLDQTGPSAIIAVPTEKVAAPTDKKEEGMSTGAIVAGAVGAVALGALLLAATSKKRR